MSKLNIDQKTIKLLLTDKHSDFLIPDYQRPYAWGEDECATLWDDLFTFAFPNDDCDAFESTSDEYFLGPIVTFKNDAGQLEIIDGQQRLTTIMLLLRAFYDKFANMKDKQSIKVRDSIAGCVWKTDEFDDPDMDALKIDSEVASDSDKDEFLDILRHGSVGPMAHSAYSRNYAFFSKRMAEMASEWPSYIALFAARILNNVILLPIEAESQDTALRIFSTLNDRGLPLADADIFKSQFYKHFSGEGRKDEFVTRWKALEETANLIFKPTSGTPLDELFTRYMYYRRAKKGIRDTTTKSLRDFYSDSSYEILREDATLDDLESLLDFWKRVDAQEGFSERVTRRLFVLNYAPNGMWAYLLSTWFLAKRNTKGELDDKELYDFLCYITGFIYAYSLERPGVNALRGEPNVQGATDMGMMVNEHPAYLKWANTTDRARSTFRPICSNARQLRDVSEAISSPTSVASRDRCLFGGPTRILSSLSWTWTQRSRSNTSMQESVTRYTRYPIAQTLRR